MTPAELRELADKAEAEAIRQASAAMVQTGFDPAAEIAEQANRLFLMARNLRERAREIEIEAAQKRAVEFMEAHREALRGAGIARNI